MMPAWRKPPPICCLKRLARAMNSAEPTRHEPTGAPSAFEKQTLTVSKGAAYSASEMLVVAVACHRRAPSSTHFR
jgi:hypothetical protein